MKVVDVPLTKTVMKPHVHIYDDQMSDHHICTCNFITVLVKGTSTPFILAYI